MTDNDQKFLVGLNHFPKFGPVKLRKLNNFFSCYKEAFQANHNSLLKAGIDEKTALEFISVRKDINPDIIMSRLEKEGIKIIINNQKNYPALLKEIYDPPPLLYYRGKFIPDEYCLAIVGSRKFTSYGQQAAEDIVKNLAQNKLVIVSGLALGIDSIAHNACLTVGGRTIAVLGTGLNKQSIYPSSNRYLADKIVAQGGLIISEFPLDTAPLRYNFPQRNRIISGLSLGTLVVEAGEKSGALITARCALDQNREVFAVPGNIYSQVSIGANNLIKQGAKPITKAEEVLEALDLKQISIYHENKKIITDSPEEKIIIKYLSFEPTHINDIIRQSGLSAPQTASILTLMEMKGIVRNLGNMKYVLGK